MIVLFQSREQDEPNSGNWSPDTGGTINDMGASDSKSAAGGRPAQLRIVGKSTMSVVGHKNGGGLSTQGKTGSNAREASSNVTVSMAGPSRRSTLFPESLAAADPIEGRLRGAFSLVWISRLSDLENGVLDSSSRDTGGIRNRDVQTLMELMLGRVPHPDEHEDETADILPVETFGANVEYVDLIPSILSSLAMTRDDQVRCAGLKQLNVLVMRNVPATRAFLSITDWQSTILPILYSVPYFVDVFFFAEIYRWGHVTKKRI